jgi:hypothetical protein
MPKTSEVSETPQFKGLTNEEMNAFLEGLSFYLNSDLPEEEKMAFGLKIVQDNLAQSESANQESPKNEHGI